MVPCIFDDGALHEQKADVLLAFANPSEEDCTLCARYNSSFFDAGSNRATVSNPHDKERLKQALEKAGFSGQTIPHEDFSAIIAPSFAQLAQNGVITYPL